MRKIVLLTIGLLFIFSDIANAQNDTNFVENVNVDSNYITKVGVKSIQLAIENVQKIIDKQQREINMLNSKIDSLEVVSSYDYSAKIDSLEEIVDVKEDIIDDMEDVIDDLEDAKEDIADALEDIDVKIQIGGLGDLCEDLDVDDFSSKRKKFKGHWAGLSLGVNGYLSADNTLTLFAEDKFMTVDYARSREFTINPVQFSIPFFNRYVGAVTGLGFTFNNYELEQNSYLAVDNDGRLVSIEPFQSINNKINKFKTISINAPLMIEFQIPVNKNDERLFVAAGVIGGLNLQGKMKTVYYDGNSKIKNKDKLSDWPLTEFNYQATARLGYDDWYLYANYSLTPLFEKNLGPQIFPVSVGLGFRF